MIFNCHTHIFNVKCAPDKFYGIPAAKFFSLYPSAARGIARVLRFLLPTHNDKLDRMAAMLEIGSEARQRDIFRILKDSYPMNPNARFVAHTIDMDFMGAGDAINNYLSQLDEVAEAKLYHPNDLLPFISVDPRRNDITTMVPDYVEDKGFVGLKLYPALGFYPFDPRLKPVYEYAVQNNLPLLTHCDTGGIFYRGTLTSDQLRPTSIDGTTHDFSAYKNLKSKRFKDLFTNPENFEAILKQPGFEKLKICLAHYGGSQMIRNKRNVSITPNNWYKSIQRMMQEYPNVYTDISYTLHNRKVWRALKTDIQNPNINNRILFGTDFYMTVREREESVLVENFVRKSGITTEDFRRIAYDNPREFLTSKFYKP